MKRHLAEKTQMKKKRTAGSAIVIVLVFLIARLAWWAERGKSELKRVDKIVFNHLMLRLEFASQGTISVGLRPSIFMLL